MEGAAYPPSTDLPRPQYVPQQNTFPGQQPQVAIGTAPPPYYPQQGSFPPQHAQQQSSNNVVVVQSQPTIVATRSRYTGDHYLTLSIVLTVLCFLCGGWPSFFCLIPAIFLSSAAREAETRGDMEDARSKARVSLILNIVSIVWYVVAAVILVIVGIVVRATSSSSSYCYTYYTSYYYSYYSTYTCI